MSMNSRLEYLKKIKGRYLKAYKKAKSQILDEYCQNTGMARKYVVRRLSAKCDLNKPKIINDHKRNTWHYTTTDISWLSKIWKIMDYPCGQRLAPILPEIIDKLVHFKELNIPKESILRLKKISSSTIDDRLKSYRREERRKINGTTKPGSLLKKQIPIRTSSWDETRIGYCELDLVAHCGDNAAGEFIYTITLTDIVSGWTENQAILGKSQIRVQEGLEAIRKRLPFPLLAIDPDNGSEFINWQLYRYCMESKIEFTRGRPYKKNDNAHVEQKNFTHVRRIFGYKRLETEKQLGLMNELYQNELRSYKSFFQPNVKLIDKKRYGKNGEKIKKIYDKAKTPFVRLLEYRGINFIKVRKKEMQGIYDELNPARLHRDILAKVDKVIK